MGKHYADPTAVAGRPSRIRGIRNDWSIQSRHAFAGAGRAWIYAERSRKVGTRDASADFKIGIGVDSGSFNGDFRDFVHVLYKGRIVKSGTKELALELEEKGYDWIKDELLETV